MLPIHGPPSRPAFGEVYCVPVPADVLVGSTRRRAAMFELNTLDEPPFELYQPTIPAAWGSENRFGNVNDKIPIEVRSVL